MKRLPIYHWPGAAPRWHDDVFVIAVATGPEREAARRAIRQALTEALAALFGAAPEAIEIAATPGQAPVALLPGGRRLHCSFAHDGGLSLAAVSQSGPVGVDLMREEDVPGWEAVANDYLGPEATARIAATARHERAAVFARAWTAREAHLKWLGVGLDEWPAHSQSAGTTVTLDLPHGLAGTLVYNGGTEHTETDR